MKLQKFCGAFALTEEKCSRSLMETAQVICAGKVEDLHFANKFTEFTITQTFFLNLYTLYLFYSLFSFICTFHKM